jgi:glutathione S-transferase
MMRERVANCCQALTAPFILRIYSLGNNGFLPKSVITGFEALPNFSKWAAEVIKHESVTYIWDEKAVLAGTAKRIEKLKAAKV